MKPTWYKTGFAAAKRNALRTGRKVRLWTWVQRENGKIEAWYVVE